MALPRTHAVQTPFDSVENAQSYIQLLIETLVEAKREIAADAASAQSARSERRLEALRLVEYKLHRLQHHLTVSGRMLNDLRRLRRLLLDETADLNLSSSTRRYSGHLLSRHSRRSGDIAWRAPPVKLFPHRQIRFVLISSAVRTRFSVS